MTDAILESWIRKESYNKAFSKDDTFIGEIRLHNVLCNQIPSAMLFKGYNQQAVRKGLLQMIDGGFADELRLESMHRRKRRPSDATVPNVPGTSESIPIETDVLLETWIRKESYRVAFSKEDTFIGEIRLHNILCNCIPASMSAQGYTPQSVRKALLKIIDEGFSEELQNESRRRRSSGQSPESITTNSTGTTFAFQPGSFSERMKAALSTKQGLQSSTLPTSSSKIEILSPNPQLPLPEVPTPPFCVQHGILTTLQSTLEAACFKFSQTHCPALLARRKWNCPHAGELNAWTKELRGCIEHGELSISTLAYDQTRLFSILKGFDDLRHTAVHRVPITGEKLVEFINTTKTAVKILGDERSVGGIEAIMTVVNSCFDESRRSKVKLNSTLELELVQLEIEKKRLEQRELQIHQAAMDEAQKADAELERSMVKGLDALNLHIHVVWNEQ